MDKEKQENSYRKRPGIITAFSRNQKDSTMRDIERGGLDNSTCSPYVLSLHRVGKKSLGGRRGREEHGRAAVVIYLEHPSKPSVGGENYKRQVLAILLREKTGNARQNGRRASFKKTCVTGRSEGRGASTIIYHKEGSPTEERAKAKPSLELD